MPDYWFPSDKGRCQNNGNLLVIRKILICNIGRKSGRDMQQVFSTWIVNQVIKSIINIIPSQLHMMKWSCVAWSSVKEQTVLYLVLVLQHVSLNHDNSFSFKNYILFFKIIWLQTVLIPLNMLTCQISFWLLFSSLWVRKTKIKNRINDITHFLFICHLWRLSIKFKLYYFLTHRKCHFLTNLFC